MSKVSIIIPCYKQAHFLPETLESVIAQTHTDWECLIVNDGSPDNTAEVAEEYARRDGRIRHIAQENRGLSGARNRGLDEAKGDWIQFLDSDDLLFPEKLKLQLDALAKYSDIALSYCDYYYCTAQNIHERINKEADFEHPRISDKEPLLDIILRWETVLSIPPHGFLFDSRLFRRHGIRFDEALPNHEDWDCWMCIFALQPAIVPVRQELVIYRQHPNSMCTNRTAMWNGYAQALHKQMRIYRSNKIIYGALRRKLEAMSVVYNGPVESHLDKVRRHALASRQAISMIYRRNMPWPFQRFISAIYQRLK